MATTKTKTLQDTFPEFDLMTIEECINELGWETENGPEEESTGAITCSCGGEVTCGGWIGPESATCKECYRGMQDMTGLLPGEGSSAWHIDYDNTEIPENGATWIPENVWGWRPE